MEVIAFVGASGTGKSYRSLMVAKKYGADAIIDDGILISNGKVIAGTSAKTEATRIASVKHALFMNGSSVAEIKQALQKTDIKRLMILGTSEKMVKTIASNLGIGEISRIIYIEDVATEREMNMALRMRRVEGKHVIPVPTFEIKQDFSGYFLHPLRLFRKNLDEEIDTAVADKSIVRPTFSYMGDYTISDNVINSMAVYEAEKIDALEKVISVNLRKTRHGIHIDMTVAVRYGSNIPSVLREVQYTVRENIEKYTSINTRRVNVLVKSLVR